jgi:CRISPR-associated endonuclease/helicase Cas3
MGDQVVLLHARLPGYLRAARTAYLRAALGRTRRPHRLVAVTTSVLDTGIDIDCDVMISDLASIAVLLQRLGRLARFALSFTGPGAPVRRPAWWKDGRLPAFHVLEPVGESGATAVPAAWRTLEPAVLLHATADLLKARGSDPLDLPGHVQDLVEAVHGEHAPFARAGSPLASRAADLHDRQTSEAHLSALHLVPPPGRVSSLADLHRQQLTAAQAATRLGILPQRLLPCYLRDDGRAALDRAGAQLLPDGDRLRTADVRHVLAHTVPVPPAWVAAGTHRHHPPASWARHPLLGDLVLLPAPAGEPHHVEQFGRYGLRMDDDLGLVVTRTTDTAPSPAGPRF